MSDLYDAPNQQAVGLDPPWVEGTGGEPGEPAAAGEAETETEPSLDSMTKAELLDYAKAHDVSPANNDMTKAELLSAIEAHEG